MFEKPTPKSLLEIQEWLSQVLLTPYFYFDDEGDATKYLSKKTAYRVVAYNKSYWRRRIKLLASFYVSFFTYVGNSRFNLLAVDFLADFPDQTENYYPVLEMFPQWLERHFPNEEKLIALAKEDWQKVMQSTI